MRSALSLLILAGFATGCDSVLNGSGLSEADVEAIEPGNANGVVYSGTWSLDVDVTESTCGGVFQVIPGSDAFFGEDGWLGTAPNPGNKGKETITFAQSGGELTRGVDELGEFYSFRGGVNQDGTFAYGMYGDLGDVLPVSLTYIEIVDGKFELSEGAGGKIEGTSQRRYATGIIDCSATMRITGSRTNLGG